MDASLSAQRARGRRGDNWPATQSDNGWSMSPRSTRDQNRPVDHTPTKRIQNIQASISRVLNVREDDLTSFFDGASGDFWRKLNQSVETFRAHGWATVRDAFEQARERRRSGGLARTSKDRNWVASDCERAISILEERRGIDSPQVCWPSTNSSPPISMLTMSQPAGRPRIEQEIRVRDSVDSPRVC